MKSFPYILKLIISTKLLTLLEIFYKELIRRVYSNEHTYKFYFNLRKEIKIPDPKIPLNVRPLHKMDIPVKEATLSGWLVPTNPDGCSNGSDQEPV